MASRLNLIVVVEDSACQTDTRMWSQHGLCIFMEMDLGSDKKRMLVDTGTSSEVTLHNIDVLNIDLDCLDLIFLSHGHYDHTGGLIGILKRMNRRVLILAHPGIFAPRVKGLPFLKLMGPPFSRTQAEDAGAVMFESRSPVAIAKSVMTTGEVERIVSFEKPEGYWTIQDGLCRPDDIPDDQALIANIEGKGLVVISGCAHAGILNTIRSAQKITGERKLYAVIGGLHLRGADNKRIASTAEALLELDPQIIRPGHCTGQKPYSLCSRCSAIDASP